MRRPSIWLGFGLVTCVWAASPQAASGANTVREIIVVFKTHFDISYTDMASNVVERYRTTMIDRALEVVDRNRDLPPEQQFVWTVSGWPMHKILEPVAGQTPDRIGRVEQALRQGRFVVHALPFTTHTELLEPEDLVRGLGYSAAISRRLGLELPRDGKMTDVPEHTRFLPTLLRHAGVDLMVIGCNGASGSPELPPLFWWQGPDGSRVLTRYSPSYGTPLEPEPGWPYRTWLAVIHTGDNHGPPKPDEVKKLLERAAREFPGVKVRIGRMSDFADAIKAEAPDLPVVTADTPDTWIHGPMSDPAGAILARNTRPLIEVTEELNTCLRGWGLGTPPAADTVAQAYEQSLLYGEHTWGGSIGWIKNMLSYGDDFQRDRANGRFERIEASWEEHSGYIRKARALIAPALSENLKALAEGVNCAGKRIVVFNPLPWKRSGVVSVSAGDFAVSAVQPAGGGQAVPVEASGGQLRFFARDLPAMGYRTYVPARLTGYQPAQPADLSELESPFFRAKVDAERGVVASLVDKRSGRELVDNSAERGFGQYLYERFDGNQVTQYCRAYLKPGRMHADFFKPGLPSAERAPYVARTPRAFELRREQGLLDTTAVMETKAGANLAAISTRLILYRDQPCADLEITVHDKPLEPWPEAGWLCLPFKVANPQFHLGRLGSIVDPAREIVPGANRHIFGINTGVAITGKGGYGIGLCPIDLPLVSLDEPGCWKFSRGFVPKRPIVYVNLFNNQWDTNFRLWNQGTWTSRVRIWSTSRYNAEDGLTTPSLEARNPLQAAVADGAAGKLPPSRRGLELGRTGVLVSAFGSNPDGPGQLLRLWEYSGRAGNCQVSLPEGFVAGSAQPVDLRGRPLGRPISIAKGRFNVGLRPFAPMTVVFAGTADAHGSSKAR